MRKFNNFIRIILILTVFLSTFFIAKACWRMGEKKESETVTIVETTTIAETTTIPETTTEAPTLPSTTKKVTTTKPATKTTTTKPATTKSNTTKPVTSAPTAQQSKYEEDENGRYYWFNASCTAYCGCGKCCGKYAANQHWDADGKQIILTASGRRAVPRYTIAMSKNFKFGTKVYIPGIGMCEVMDRGGAVKGNVIDIYFGSHEEALNWGRRSIKVKIYV